MARKGLYLGGSALLLAVVLLLVFWGRPADAEIQVLKAPRAVVWKDFLGVNAQFLWFSPERYNKQIDRLQDLGLEWVRLDLHWDRLETAEDQYQLASLDQLVKDLEARQPEVGVLPGRLGPLHHHRAVLLALPGPVSAARPGSLRPAHGDALAALPERGRLAGMERAQPDRLLAAQGRPGRLRQAAPGQHHRPAHGRPGEAGGFRRHGLLQRDARRPHHVRRPRPPGRGEPQHHRHLPPYTQLPEGNYPWNLDFVSHANQINRALRNAGVPAIWSTEWGWSATRGRRSCRTSLASKARPTTCCVAWRL